MPATLLRCVLVFVVGVVLTKFGCLSAIVVVVHRYRPLDGILFAVSKQTL